MITLVDGDFVECFWLGEAKGMDFLGCLYKHDGAWSLRYRFRYHSPRSKDPFDTEDTKNWYTGSIPADRNIAEAVQLLTEIVFGGVPNLRRVDVRGDQRAFLDLMAKEDRAHTRVEKL